jgi:hypothetical protein
MIGTRVYCKLTDAHTGCPKNGVLTVHYGKRQKNVKKILLDLFADLAVFESGSSQVNYFEIYLLNCHDSYL